MGEVTDEGIDLAQGEGRRRVPLEVASNEAVVRDLQLQRGGASILDCGRAVLLHQRQDAEDAAHPGLPVARAARASNVSVVGGVRVGRSAGWIA